MKSAKDSRPRGILDVQVVAVIAKQNQAHEQYHRHNPSSDRKEQGLASARSKVVVAISSHISDPVLVVLAI